MRQGSVWPKSVVVALIAVSLAIAAGLLAWRLSAQSTPPALAATSVFPQPAQKDRVVLWAVGDGADGSSTSRRLASQIARTRFDRLLYLGDVYERGTASEFRTNYAPSYGRMRAKTWPTPGNHDWPRHPEGYDPYWANVTGGRPPTWYQKRVAGWQIISLNSEAPHSADSPQGRWLERQLRRPGTCRLAFWHRPRFSAGAHGDQKDMAPVWDALRGHAAIVVNGHDHDMQRLRPINGITEFVSGAGGRELYDVDESDPHLAFANDRTYGALKLELRRGVARYAFVALGGRVLDSGTISCRP
jgi:hypothetical protein